MKNGCFWLLAALVAAAAAGPAFAAGPEMWEMTLQPAATPTMERITEFHSLLLYIITAISLFVFALMLFICIRFWAPFHSKPSQTTHNTLLEVVWTVIPVVILIIIAVPSFKLLYYADRTEAPDLTIKVTGYQWYWNYTFPGAEGEEFAYDSRLVDEKDIDPAKGQKRLLSVDNPLVLPVGENIRILVTAGPDDVIHSFAVPAFGIKLDAVPGRINETWARIEKPGTYYGQCSELCGKGHAYMPIEIRAVSREEFEAWQASARQEFASYDDFKAGRAAVQLALQAGETQQ